MDLVTKWCSKVVLPAALKAVNDRMYVVPGTSPLIGTYESGPNESPTAKKKEKIIMKL